LEPVLYFLQVLKVEEVDLPVEEEEEEAKVEEVTKEVVEVKVEELPMAEVAVEAPEDSLEEPSLVPSLDLFVEPY
jgi:hypothetical protein